MNAAKHEAPEGRSWCCRMPVIRVGQHWECSECGAPNASNTEHQAVPTFVAPKPITGDERYIRDLLKEAA